VIVITILLVFCVGFLLVRAYYHQKNLKAQAECIRALYNWLNSVNGAMGAVNDALNAQSTRMDALQGLALAKTDIKPMADA
jgi:hypothetical protein